MIQNARYLQGLAYWFCKIPCSVLCKLTITKVSCNKTEHTVEYCNGYRAGAVQSDVDDDPDDNTMPSKVICQGGSPGSEYCRGYQLGYADEDHASAH